MPIIPVRLEGICRTWADNLDPWDIQPGIHHVTLAGFAGVVERSFITLLELQDMKKMVSWLDGANSNTWAPKRLAEGVIRLESDIARQHLMKFHGMALKRKSRLRSLHLMGLNLICPQSWFQSILAQMLQ